MPFIKTAPNDPRQIAGFDGGTEPLGTCQPLILVVKTGSQRGEVIGCIFNREIVENPSRKPGDPTARAMLFPLCHVVPSLVASGV